MSELINENLIKHFERDVDGFTQFNVKKRKNSKNLALVLLSLIAQNYDSDKYEHKLHKDCFYISKKTLKKMFGVGKFDEILNGLGITLVEQAHAYSFDDKATYPYRLTDNCMRLMREFYASQSIEPSNFVDSHSFKVNRKPPKGAIATKTNKGANRKSTFNIPSDPLIDVYRLMTMKQELEDTKENGEATDKIDRQISEIETIVNMTTNRACYGRLIQRYKEYPSGRLYGEGIHLQSTSREVRNAALHGMYDYDIENCHFTILEQLAAKSGFTCSGIGYYLANKKLVRTSIALSVGISVKQVKKCLLAFVYGARKSVFGKGAIILEIGREAAERLYQNEKFLQIHDDVSKAGKVVLKNAKSKMHSDKLVNYMGYEISDSECSKVKQKLANLIQSVEAKILNIVGELYGDELVLLIHDGWVSKTALDCSLIKAEIRKQLDLDVDIDECVIGDTMRNDEMLKAA